MCFIFCKYTQFGTHKNCPQKLNHVAMMCITQFVAPLVLWNNVNKFINICQNLLNMRYFNDLHVCKHSYAQIECTRFSYYKRRLKFDGKSSFTSYSQLKRVESKRYFSWIKNRRKKTFQNENRINIHWHSVRCYCECIAKLIFISKCLKSIKYC